MTAPIKKEIQKIEYISLKNYDKFLNWFQKNTFSTQLCLTLFPSIKIISHSLPEFLKFVFDASSMKKKKRPIEKSILYRPQVSRTKQGIA